MKIFTKTRVVVGTAITAAVLLGSGIAFAFVLANGKDHQDEHAAAANTHITVSDISITPVTDFSPSVSRPVTVTIHNSQPNKLQINTAVASLSGNTCTSTIHLTPLSTPTLPVVLASGADYVFSVTLSMDDSDTVDQTSCLDAAYLVPISVSVNGGLVEHTS